MDTFSTNLVNTPAVVEDNSATEEMVYATSTPTSDSQAALYYDYLTVYNNKELDRCEVYKAQVRQDEKVLFYDVRCPIGHAVLLGSDRLSPNEDVLFQLCISKDLKLVRDVLESRQWDVSVPDSSATYLTSEMWDSRLEELLSSNFSTYSSFLFYYTGHGDAHGVLLGDGSCKPYTDIVKAISSLKSLASKPKIFIFDSCRRNPTEAQTSFSQEIDAAYNELKDDKYPPPDTIICYSANEGSKSYTHIYDGSFYTQVLTRMLRQFMDRFTFTEIVTLTHGWVRRLACQYKKEQQPVMQCALNSLLVLRVQDERMEEFDLRRVPYQPTSSPVMYADKSQLVFVRHKGAESSAHLDRDVTTDAVRKGKIQFKTREDVVDNIPRLGRGVSVFICYAPDPDSPYYDPNDQHRQSAISCHKKYVTSLIHDLERLGFTVISDLHLGETQPRNWLQWYVSRIEQCDYLIMVCSPAFKELFSCEKPKNPILDKRALWFPSYRIVMYSEIHKEVTESSQTSKFLPVILDERYLPDDSVPALFGMAPSYQLGSDGNRTFNYDNMMGDYERLVCRMAGIDRMKMEKPVDHGVVKVAPPFSQGQGTVGGYPGLRAKKRGYKSKQWQPSTAASTTSEQVTQPPPAKQPKLSTQAQPNSSSHTTVQEAQAINQQPQDLTPHPLESNSSSQVQPPPPPSSLPDKPPSQPIILWLSRNITNWRMVARLLHMNESEIERISNDNRGEEGEQRAQMFVSWQRHRTREYSYLTLGDVLLNTESNRDLYRDFYQKVEAEQST